MHRFPLTLSLLAAAASAQQPRVPVAFDAGLGAQPARTQQKLTALGGKLPAGFLLPADFSELASGPDGVSPPTTRVWLSDEAKALYLRGAGGDGGVMSWPASTRCARHLAFALPVSTLLIVGASASCTTSETAVRAQLTPGAVAACVDVDEPERYATSSLVPPGLSQTQLNSFVDQRTQTLEAQLALAGAGLQQFPVPSGLLPADWVPTLRSVLWKLLSASQASRLQQARVGYATALSTLTTSAACFDATKRAGLEAEVQQLDAELAAVQAHVDSVIATGLARADQQRLCLATRSRTRPVLPVPSLTDEEREFIGFWLGGVTWRMRGGGLLALGSTQNARTFFARRPMRELARLGNGTVVAERAADSLYCALFDGWGEWMDLGTTAGGQDFYEDLVQLTDRGRQQVADWTLSAVGAALTNGLSNTKSAEAYLREAGFSTAPLLAGGLSMGPCYAYALNPMKAFVFDQPGAAQAPYSSFIDNFTAQGEFCFGASIGLGLTRTLLAGTATNQAPTSLCGARVCGLGPCGGSCGTCSGTTSCDGSGQCVAGPVDAGPSPVDAGVPPDAGRFAVDAGAPGLEDAGVDAGSAEDAGVVVTSPDAGAPTDAGTEGPAPDSGLDGQAPVGCGCDASPDTTSVLGVLLVALAGLRRRAVGSREFEDMVPLVLAIRRCASVGVMLVLTLIGTGCAHVFPARYDLETLRTDSAQWPGEALVHYLSRPGADLTACEASTFTRVDSTLVEPFVDSVSSERVPLRLWVPCAQRLLPSLPGPLRTQFLERLARLVVTFVERTDRPAARDRRRARDPATRALARAA